GTNALYRVGVTRSGTTGEVTNLVGPAVKVFDGDSVEPGIDAGLERGPSGTLFYSYFDANYLAERPAGGAGSETRYSLADVGGPLAISGLTFSPFRTDPSTGFGRLLIANGYLRFLYEVPLGAESPAGSGRYPLQSGATLTGFAKVARAGLGAIQFVPAGTFQGDLLYAATANGELRLVMIDPATGLPY